MKKFEKMNPKYKGTWVEKLRSREYKQTIETLQDDHGFCCLGVLCHATKTRYISSEGDLNPDQMAKFGLSVDVTYELIRMNDDKGLKFGKIANWIDKNL